LSLDENKRIALVTGANRGLGLETCRQLSKLGLAVLLSARNIDKGQRAVKQLTNDGLEDITFCHLDVLNQNGLDRVAYNIEQEYGHLDVLINNAAILYDYYQTSVAADLNVVNQAFATNFFAPWRLCKAFIPMMRKNKYGRIVNVSSLAGSLHYMNEGGAPAYTISKAALNALTRKLAAEVLGAGILINSIDPGWVATQMGGSGGRPVEEGAKGIVWAATLPEDGPTGGFFFDSRPEPW
jgi:NAD(P)-dependent dehydrogenase (short-subunit alcohol dehydrogenase family)